MIATTSDFFIKDNILHCRYSGYSFIFFVSSSCKYCDDVKPVFDLHASMWTKAQIKFAYMYVEENNREIVKLTKGTNLEITYVPLLIMFHNGKPITQFVPDEENPQNNNSKMKQFLITSLNGDQPANEPDRNSFSYQNKKVCYLKFEDAYNHA